MRLDKVTEETISRAFLVLVIFGFANMILANALFWKIVSGLLTFVTSAVFVMLPYFFFISEEDE